MRVGTNRQLCARRRPVTEALIQRPRDLRLIFRSNPRRKTGREREQRTWKRREPPHGVVFQVLNFRLRGIDLYRRADAYRSAEPRGEVNCQADHCQAGRDPAPSNPANGCGLDHERHCMFRQ